MDPISLSATAISVFESCPARYEAEYIRRGKGMSNDPADLGTVCHAALEAFVRRTQIEGHSGDVTDLLGFYDSAYDEMFGSQMELHSEGQQMLTDWWLRTKPGTGYFHGRKVLQVETKMSFTLKARDLGGVLHELPFNYIFDRFDQLTTRDNEFEVVDYKTIRKRMNPSDLRDHIQCRVYSVAAQIMRPEAKRIWVTLDMLRHDGPVGIVFSRDENVAAYRFLQNRYARILAAQEPFEEKLNPECPYCVRKLECDALRRHVDVGGILGLGDLDVAIDKRAGIASAHKALERSLAEVDDFILRQMEVNETLSHSTATTLAEVTASKRRTVDAERAAHVLGPDIMARYGTLTIKSVDTILKEEPLTSEQRAELNDLITVKFGEPTIKTKPVNPISDEE